MCLFAFLSFCFFFFFFFNDTATTEIYTLSLHDALPIWPPDRGPRARGRRALRAGRAGRGAVARDRKSTRLNSSHVRISYAVFCLKKKNMDFFRSGITCARARNGRRRARARGDRRESARR